MADISLPWAGDLSIGPTGDLSLASSGDRVQQRMLRRLLTASGAYLWQPSYGAGLGRFVGAAVDPRHIRAIVEAQLQLEAVIASDPAPIVKIGRATQGGDSLTLEITYWETGGSVARAVSVPLEA